MMSIHEKQVQRCPHVTQGHPVAAVLILATPHRATEEQARALGTEGRVLEACEVCVPIVRHYLAGVVVNGASEG